VLAHLREVLEHKVLQSNGTVAVLVERLHCDKVEFNRGRIEHLELHVCVLAVGDNQPQFLGQVDELWEVNLAEIAKRFKDIILLRCRVLNEDQHNRST
jgi:hypothetical protein